MSHIIPLADASAMNEAYRDNKDAILATGVDPDTLPICETFSRGDFDDMLAQTGCVGVRCYFSLNDDRQVCLVIVGVDENDADMINPQSTTNIIIEKGRRCPLDCPPKSDLN